MTTMHASDSCPDLVVLSAYIDGSLALERVADVTRHVTRCARCRDLIANVCAIERELEPNVAAFHPRIVRIVAVAAASLLVVVIGLLLRPTHGRVASNAIEKLVEASPESARSIESRISGGFRWAPFLGERRTGSRDKTDEQLAASGVAGTVLREIGGDRSAKSLHAAGVAYLVAGDPQSAARVLGEAAHMAPGNARVWSDLAAALYANAVEEDKATLQRALNATERAIRLNPRLLEAYFNRALILERIGTRQQAEAAWREYLARDSGGAWATEARARMQNAPTPHK